MKRFLLLLFACCSLSLYAITPGYMGRRLIVYYGISGMPMTGAIYNGERILDFNFKHQFGAEYILSKSRVIGVSGELINDYLTLHGEDGYDPGPQLSVIYGWTWQISTKRYNFSNRGSIAPVGWYRMCSLGFSSVRVTDNGKYFASGRKNLGGSVTPVFVFGFGKSTVWWDRIAVDGSTRFGFAFNGLLKHYVKERDSYGMDEITRKSAVKVFAAYTIGIHVTFGLLVK
jgi:hypothetical protein